MQITIEIDVAADLEKVWAAWTTPDSITKWNFATDEWHCPTASLNLVPGGTFNYRMEAKDGSMGFDFTGKFTQIDRLSTIHYQLDDGRNVAVRFAKTSDGVKITETFDAEDENSAEQQRLGWLGILNNFKAFVEAENN
ncbi:MAG: ATPase [Gammaproteobacteria bacterium]|nr:ATPase [Gammaproteobacteria bacterium]